MSHSINHYDLLNQLAEKDEIYRLWEKSDRESTEAFAEFANSQPEEVKNLLWTYAESGRLMYQRKVNLACEYMEFKKREQP